MLRSYTPADALTIGNAACGTIAIFLCLDFLATDSRRFLWLAFLLLPRRSPATCWTATSRASTQAAVDPRRRPRLARRRDLVRRRAGGARLHARPARRLDMLILAFFVVCGVSRLARFNVTADALADPSTAR